MADPVATLREALADRYAIQRELGAGGMATVYLAEDLKHRRQVAVKVLRPELAAVLGPDRFLREIEIAARLQHPHILPLFDSGHASGFLYYVMPYVEGESLRGRLVREGALPIPEAARILRDVADALAHAHARGVVHRDIKPENVMLSGRHALVTDFGVAKAVSEASGRQQLTTAGVALGTPAYMAPEQAAADPNMDHRVDVYALGVVAYELLTGRPPFEGGSPQETLAAHVTKAPQPVSTHRGTVPPGLAQLVMKCLEKRPADRCQKAEELVGQLEGFTTPSGGVTPTDTRPLNGVRSSARKYAVLVAVIGLGIGLYALGPGRPSGLARATDPKVVRLAVLPLENRGRIEDEFFADGISDEIHVALRRIPGLTVVGLRASMRFKGSRLSLREIGDSLDVDYLLTGTVQWDGQARASSKVRVSPELVRIIDETSRWRESYDRAYRDIFGLQAEIADRVALALSLVIGPSSGRVVIPAAIRSTTPEVHSLYLRGREGVAEQTRPGFERAERFLTRAVQLDPTYAPALAMLAQAQFELDLRDGNLSRSMATAVRAVGLDSGSAEAYVALGRVQRSSWDIGGAEASFRKAIALDPNHEWAYGFLGQLLAFVGRFDESLALAWRARELDPLFWGDAPLFPLFGLRRFDEVIRLARSGLAADSSQTSNLYWEFLGRALLEVGEDSAALQAFDRERTRGGARWEFSWTLARAGRTQDAQRALHELLSRRLNVADQAEVARLYANLGPSDSAFAWLDRLYARHAPALLRLRWDTAWDPIRSDRRFKELLKKIGLEK